MIRLILFAGTDWTDRHQGLMLAGVAACVLLVAALEKVLP